MRILGILYNIRSAHNVGSIFRSADGAGVEHLFLVGYTPAPVDRFGRAVPEIEKTSLGATHSVPYSVEPDIEALMVRLRQEGVRVVAVEQHPRAEPYTTIKRDDAVACIFGNEIEGVTPRVCDAADAVIHIPMQGMKESLNVSVAAGIIFFHLQSLSTQPHQ